MWESECACRHQPVGGGHPEQQSDCATAHDATPRREKILLVGHRPDEHGVLREIACGVPHVVMCRLCNGERDCPYVAARSPMRVTVTRRDVPEAVLPVPHRRVRTGMRAGPGWTAWPAFLAAGLGWLAVAALVLRYWILSFPPLAEVVSVVGLKLGVFAFVLVGVPFVRMLWSGRGGRFRRRE